MRHLTPLALLLLGGFALHSTPANAGGLGIVGTTGFHQARLYYYDSNDLQYLNRQNRPNNGVGLEVILGDKDDRILGVARGYYMIDSPVVAPPDPQVTEPIYTLPDSPTHIGMATVGVHWGVIGDPTGFQAHIASHLGAGIVTVDGGTGEGNNLEFLLGEAGIGATYHFARSFQAYVDVAGAVRYRKAFYPGANAYLGLRYMFD